MSDLRVMLLGDRNDLQEGDLWRPDNHTQGERQYKWRIDKDFVDRPDGERLVIARPVTTFGRTQAKMGFEEWHNTPRVPPEVRKGWRRFL